MLEVSRWAGNVGELAKQRGPISSPLFLAFTPLPYYRVYRSAFTPLSHPAPAARSGRTGASEREESGEKENKHKKRQVTPHQRGELSQADLDFMRLPAACGVRKHWENGCTPCNWGEME